jgi:hypothetical protein
MIQTELEAADEVYLALLAANKERASAHGRCDAHSPEAEEETRLSRNDLIERFDSIDDRLRHAHSILCLISDHHAELPEAVIDAATQAENHVSDAKERVRALHSDLVPSLKGGAS